MEIIKCKINFCNRHSSGDTWKEQEAETTPEFQNKTWKTGQPDGGFLYNYLGNSSLPISCCFSRIQWQMHWSQRIRGASIFAKFNTKVSILAFGKNVQTQSCSTWGHKKVYDHLCLLIHSTDTPVSPLWCFYLRTSRLCGEVLSFTEVERVERKKGGRHSIQQSHPETFLPHITQIWFVTRIVWITTQVLQQRYTNNT